MAQDVAEFKATLQSFINETTLFVKMIVIMYFVILICIIYILIKLSYVLQRNRYGFCEIAIYVYFKF